MAHEAGLLSEIANLRSRSRQTRFLGNLIAERFRFEKADFFDIEDIAEREVPKFKLPK